MQQPLAFRPHPWHGVDPGERFPEVVTAYVEMVPSDGVKYEIDKHTGFLKIDRPQRFSVSCPTLYGFVPRTYCGEAVAAVAVPGGPGVTHGDGDPLDVCILTDRAIPRGDVLLEARPIGGLRMVEKGDPTYGELESIGQLARAVVDRLRHYFLTYKAIPGDAASGITVDPVYDVETAHAVLTAARADYRRRFPEAAP